MIHSASRESGFRRVSSSSCWSQARISCKFSRSPTAMWSGTPRQDVSPPRCQTETHPFEHGVADVKQLREKRSVTFIASQDFTSRAVMQCALATGNVKGQRIGMEKVWQLQHQISRFCADIFTVSAREVCLRDLPCCSWRLAEAYGPNKDAMKLFCRTTLCARDVTQLKSNQKTADSTFAKETPQVTLTLLTKLPRQTGFLPEARGLTKPELRSFSSCEA